jgi:hypothetical protein
MKHFDQRIRKYFFQKFKKITKDHHIYGVEVSKVYTKFLMFAHKQIFLENNDKR